MKLEVTARDMLLLKITFTALILIVSIRFLILPQVKKADEAQERLAAATAAAETIQNKIEEKEELETELAGCVAELQEMAAPYYGTLENRELDELVTGIALRHRLFPLALSIGESESRIPEPYLYSDGGVRDAKPIAAEEETEEETEDGDWENPEEAEIAAAAAAAEAAAAGIDIEQTEAAAQTEGYVSQTEITMSLRGDEADVMTFLDDIWKNYPAIQIKTMQLAQETYADENLEAVGQTQLECVLIVYMCSELEQE